MDEALCAKLTRFEQLLTQIEQNGRGDSEEKFYVWRSDLDEKLASVFHPCLELPYIFPVPAEQLSHGPSFVT